MQVNECLEQVTKKQLANVSFLLPFSFLSEGHTCWKMGTSVVVQHVCK